MEAVYFVNLTDITPEEVLRGFLGRKILGRRVRSGVEGVRGGAGADAPEDGLLQERGGVQGTYLGTLSYGQGKEAGKLKESRDVGIRNRRINFTNLFCPYT